MGIGTTTPQIHLAIVDDDSGLHCPSDGNLAFYTNNKEQLRIDSSGNVGIGTTTPQIHLAIADDDSGLHCPSDGNLAFYTNNKERLRIDSDGNLLFDHNAKLKFTTGAFKSGIFNTPDYYGFQFGFPSVGHLGIGTLSSDSSATFNQIMIVKHDGHVGIGTSQPTETLEVAGTVKATNFVGDGALVKGLIMLWATPWEDIPDGWLLCDGKNGTPNFSSDWTLSVAHGDSWYEIPYIIKT